jgi:hypothetical protein
VVLAAGEGDVVGRAGAAVGAAVAGAGAGVADASSTAPGCGGARFPIRLQPDSVPARPAS